MPMCGVGAQSTEPEGSIGVLSHDKSLCAGRHLDHEIDLCSKGEHGIVISIAAEVPVTVGMLLTLGARGLTSALISSVNNHFSICLFHGSSQLAAEGNVPVANAAGGGGARQRKIDRQQRQCAEPHQSPEYVAARLLLQIPPLCSAIHKSCRQALLGSEWPCGARPRARRACDGMDWNLGSDGFPKGRTTSELCGLAEQDGVRAGHAPQRLCRDSHTTFSLLPGCSGSTQKPPAAGQLALVDRKLGSDRERCGPGRRPRSLSPRNRSVALCKRPYTKSLVQDHPLGRLQCE